MWREQPLHVVNISTGLGAAPSHTCDSNLWLEWGPPFVSEINTFVSSGGYQQLFGDIWRVLMLRCCATVKLMRPGVMGGELRILVIFHQIVIKRLFPPLCAYTVSLCSNRNMDSKLAPSVKAIRTDNFSKQIPYIPQPLVPDKMVYVWAACLAIQHSPVLLHGKRKFAPQMNSKWPNDRNIFHCYCYQKPSE